MKKPELKDLTLREKIGQTFILRNAMIGQIEDPEEYFKNNPIGCFWPLSDPVETYKYIEEKRGNSEMKGRKDEFFIDTINLMNRCMKVPVLPAIDAPYGIQNFKFEGHPQLPQRQGIGATNDPELSYEYAKCLGKDLKSIGIRWTWSPTADNSGVSKDLRHIMGDHDRNALMLSKFIEGMHAAGVATAVKHFPGADPYEYRDSHFCTSMYSPSMEEWEATQGKDFMACINGGVDAIMLSHKIFKAVDDTKINGKGVPCSLSKKVMTDFIKGELGFKGVLLTDDAEMKACKAIYPIEKLCVEMLKAGVDMVLGPRLLNYIDIVEEAVLSGELPESRIDDACQRVLNLKESLGMFSMEEIPYPTDEERAQLAEEIHQVAVKIANKGLTLTANHNKLIPVSKKDIKKALIVYIGYMNPAMKGYDECYESIKEYAIAEFKRHGCECDIQKGFKREDNDKIDDYDLIVYATYIGFHAPRGGNRFYGDECGMMALIMTKGVEKSVAASFGDPDIYFNYFTAAPTYVNCYSFNKETVEGFVKGLYGELQFTDFAPFPLNPITKTNDVY